SVSNFTIIEGTQLVITGNLTYYNGTPIPNVQLLFYIYIYYKNVSNNVNAFVPEYFDLREILTGITDLSGLVTVAFEMTEDVEYVIITGEFIGDDIKGKAKFILDEEVFSIPAPGIQKWLLYTIIAGSILLFSIISFVIYKLTRPKPFEQLMSEVEDEEIFAKLVEISPGVFINIFDQTKGAIPIVTDHNLDGIYLRRLAIGVDNFLLKIADQAYSSLGFEDHHDRRRIGSILLPNEGMVGLIHGIQLPNVAARGGFENLTLIVLVNEAHDTGLLGNQVYLFDEIDELILQLKERKPLEIIKEQLRVIRNKTTRIVLASLIEEPLDSDLLEK
ncbi:MAG: hypothetical protein H7641_02485, partial [Candidatus Heimdallarchaeota archaeon]|nr:hypothetical protein [Candidatus Heimdallarchaeota archaeon]MCK4876431.1 hypothetical protein [Candidatus Heimdallarchaeota archaeon]